MYPRNHNKINRSSKNKMIIFVLILGLIFYSIKNFFFDKMNVVSENTMTKERIESIVKDYIVNNPELVSDAMKSSHEKAIKKAEEKTKTILLSRKDEIESTKTSPFEGKHDADITIVEFFDYKCGYCKISNKVINQLIAEDRNIKVIFKQYPILGEDSYLAAKSALAIFEINPKKYVAFHNKLIEIRNINKESIHNLVKEMGFDFALFEKTMSNESIDQELKNIRELAREININGTPAFIINGNLIPGALDLDSLKNKISQIRKNK